MRYGSTHSALATAVSRRAAATGRCRRDGIVRADNAEAAANRAHVGRPRGRPHELADEAYNLTDLTDEVSRQSGRAIPYENLSEADYAAVLAGFGLPIGVARAPDRTSAHRRMPSSITAGSFPI